MEFLGTKVSTKTNLLSPDVIFQAQNAPKPIFGQGLAPDHTGGAYDTPPDLLVGWGGGHSSLYTCNPSNRRLVSSPPQYKFLPMPLGRVVSFEVTYRHK